MRGGFLGSRIWKVLEREIEGAWGDINAEIGIDAWDKLRRDEGRRGALPATCPSLVEGGRLERC